MPETLPHIFCVDDDPLNLELLTAFLEDDFLITCLSDGQQCLDAIKQQTPDIILLDFMMPVLDGKQTCRQLKSSEKTKDIPVIILSGKSFQEDIDSMYDAGADDYLAKPFTVTQLINMINKYLPS